MNIWKLNKKCRIKDRKIVRFAENCPACSKIQNIFHRICFFCHQIVNVTKWVKVSSGVWKPSTKTEWWILSLQYIIIFHYFFNEGLCKLNKWWKMTEKKWQEHVLLYHFLNDEKQSNGVYWEEKTYSTACAETWIRWVTESSLRCTDICVYLKEKNMS